MGIIEDALADFVVNHFEDSFEDVDKLKDELSDLRSQVNDLEDKVDQLLDGGQANVEQSGGSSDTKDAKTTRVTASTLKNMRSRLDLTQQELADLLDVSSASITSWESGNTKPRENNKEKIVALRDKSKSEVDQLLDRDDNADAQGTDLRSIREEHGLTQKEFAEKIGVSVTTVYNWESGETSPGSDRLEQIKNLDLSGSDDAGGSDTNSAEEIRSLRKEKDLTQSELAEELGVSAGTVSNWERGESSPDESTLEELKNL